MTINIRTQAEVEAFLQQFMPKFSIWGHMWVFGKDVDEKEIYIKIAMGHPSSNTICISFHIAEHPINYAFK